MLNRIQHDQTFQFCMTILSAIKMGGIAEQKPAGFEAAAESRTAWAGMLWNAVERHPGIARKFSNNLF